MFCFSISAMFSEFQESLQAKSLFQRRIPWLHLEIPQVFKHISIIGLIIGLKKLDIVVMHWLISNN
jgi:hypothetical protein